MDSGAAGQRLPPRLIVAEPVSSGQLLQTEGYRFASACRKKELGDPAGWVNRLPFGREAGLCTTGSFRRVLLQNCGEVFISIRAARKKNRSRNDDHVRADSMRPQFTEKLLDLFATKFILR
jgi:hypothetical protein